MPPPTKKRKISALAPEKIDFDPSAREEYLTGFHRRKVARQKHAQEEAAKREKEEKLRFRRELRQQRKQDLEKHVEEVNRLVRQANGEVEAFSSSSSSASENDDDNGDDENGGEEVKGFQEPEPINQQDEYVDEDKYTTVTIESVGISRTGFLKPGGEAEEGQKDEEKDDEVKDGGKQDGGGIKRDASGKRIWTKERPKVSKPKKKKKNKFRYEPPAQRKADRMKQALKKKKQKEARTSK